MGKRVLLAACLLAGLCLLTTQSVAGELLIGAASADIIPMGQFRLRIASKIETPLTVNVLALESRESDQSLDVAILVSCDLIAIPDSVLGLVREEAQKRLPDLDTKKIFLNGPHTHTAPILEPGYFVLPNEGVTPIEEYRAFLVQRIAEAGDQCPHLMYRKAAEQRLRRLRGGNENTRRIVRAVNEAFEAEEVLGPVRSAERSGREREPRCAARTRRAGQTPPGRAGTALGQSEQHRHTSPLAEPRILAPHAKNHHTTTNTLI